MGYPLRHRHALKHPSVSLRPAPPRQVDQGKSDTCPPPRQVDQGKLDYRLNSRRTREVAGEFGCVSAWEHCTLCYTLNTLLCCTLYHTVQIRLNLLHIRCALQIRPIVIHITVRHNITLNIRQNSTTVGLLFCVLLHYIVLYYTAGLLLGVTAVHVTVLHITVEHPKRLSS